MFARAIYIIILVCITIIIDTTRVDAWGVEGT